MDSIIQMKKEYTEIFPGYVVEPILENIYVMTIKCHSLHETLKIATILEDTSIRNITIIDDTTLQIS